jgi:hypothetical protein
MLFHCQEIVGATIGVITGVCWCCLCRSITWRDAWVSANSERPVRSIKQTTDCSGMNCCDDTLHCTEQTSYLTDCNGVFTRADCSPDNPLSFVVSVNVSIELSVGPFLGHTNVQIDGQCLDPKLWTCWRDRVSNLQWSGSRSPLLPPPVWRGTTGSSCRIALTTTC